jgi:hypothetical protein
MGSGWQPGSSLTSMEAGKMVDTLGFVAAREQLPPWLLAEFDSPLAMPQLVGSSIVQRRKSLRIDNINLKENASGNILIENSPHRFFHGHNGGTFTLADLAAATQKLSDTLGFDVSGCQPTKVAFGANLTGLDVQSTLEAITDYKSKRFTRYEKGNSITGAKRLLTEFDIKLYDKKRELADKRQAQLLVPTLRYEITSRKLSYLRQLGVTTVADLATPKFFEKAGKELEARLVACGFTEQLNTASLLADEIEALALVSSPFFAAYAANRANKDRTPRRRKLAEKARAKATLTNTKASLLERLKATLAELS